MECFRPGGLELTQKALDKTELKAGDKVLDIGCGLGASLEYIREKYKAEVYGVDVQPLAVQRAAERLGPDRVFCTDAAKLPFESGSFHLALMECVLTLIPEPEKALQEALRVMTPGGCLAITSLTGKCEGSLCRQGRMELDQLRKSLEKLGAEIIFCSDETAMLRQFIAEMIFRFDSLENYIAQANQSLGGSILNCSVPIKGTGYALIIIKKAQ